MRFEEDDHGASLLPLSLTVSTSPTASDRNKSFLYGVIWAPSGQCPCRLVSLKSKPDLGHGRESSLNNVSQNRGSQQASAECLSTMTSQHG